MYKNIIIILSISHFLFLAFPLHALDEEYHSPEEIYIELSDLQNQYPEWIVVDSIGHSSQYQMPIWQAKVSDNPAVIENEPALLFVGQIHAEEVEGIEVTLALIHDLLENIDEEQHRRRVEELELYFIPSMNPEGLQVVHDGLDETFRKNCLDNMGDGIFRYSDEWGWDSSGVDLNRNFGLHWERGLGLFEREDEFAAYNYYRGPAPFSEPEVRAVAEIGIMRRFQYSIVYHSSRSGLNSQSIVAPWYWGPRKYPPDNSAIQMIELELADRMPTQDGDDFYDPRQSTQRNGQSQDWFYQALGNMQYLVEIGADIQPDYEIMEELIDVHMGAAYYLMHVALGDSMPDGFGTMTVIATDAETGEPLQVDLDIVELRSPLVESRKTCETNGRFDWLLSSARYYLNVTAPGYAGVDSIEVPVFEGEREVVEAALERREYVNLQIMAHDAIDNAPLNGVLRLSDQYGYDYIYDVAGEGEALEIPTGQYFGTIHVEGYLPVQVELHLSENDEIAVNMHRRELVFEEDFSQDQGWNNGGPGGSWGIVLHDGRSCLTESDNGEYLPESDTWLMIDIPVDLHADSLTAIRMIHQPNIEPGSDFGRLKIWDLPNQTWITLLEVSQFPAGWDTTWMFIDEIRTGDIHIKLEVESDRYMEQDGWLIDQLYVYQTTNRENRIKPGPSLPGDITLVNLFPNPANGKVQLKYQLYKPNYTGINLFDHNGRYLRSVLSEFQRSGLHQITLPTDNLPSGTYFLVIELPGGNVQKPVFILR